MSTKTEIQSCIQSGKRVRTVNPFPIIDRAVRVASLRGLGAHVEHGGSVPNCYNYPATSECFGAVAVRTHGRGGVAYGSYATLPANKISNSGAANATLGVRAPLDNRMGSLAEQRDYAILREYCWRDGDVRWVETGIGGLYWLSPVSGVWRNAKGTKRQDPAQTVSGKRALRVMRRLCPSGWSVVCTPASQGASPTPAWRCGAEEYHIAASGKDQYAVRGSISAAAKAFATRVQAKQDAALAALLDSGAAADVYVCASDSARAGNCATGTQSFAARHVLDMSRHYRAAELLPLANGDSRFVRAAIIAGMRREKHEMTIGFSLLSDHGK